jgi:hypothetical protein
MPRKIPAPFKRPSINLEDTGRSWQHLPAFYVQAGDIVADLGLVGEVMHAGGILNYVVITNRFGDSKRFEPHEQVFAFVPHGTPTSLPE